VWAENTAKLVCYIDLR